MILESSRDPGDLSNSWLVADHDGGAAIVIDPGAPPAPLLAAIARHRLTPTLLLATHHHGDHVAHAADYRARFGCKLLAHKLEAAHLPDADGRLQAGEALPAGTLSVRVLDTPGHTAGHLAFVVGDLVFTGDALFRGSVGGTVGPGGSFPQLRRSVLDVLLSLPGATRVCPGHMEPTTIADEDAGNPFVRAWRGLDPPAEQPCTALGRPATLLLRARDYDAGTKCWVRYADSGELAVVPGSRVLAG
ncbi:MAG TPA: MBL fold metallo-hydrolase [Candidatus Polarisedimenticolaceae bacterium]|nr:MBL fold metallo-hydrolase [Candidatus Polarisedimenticolaceae bacterium]